MSVKNVFERKRELSTSKKYFTLTTALIALIVLLPHDIANAQTKKDHAFTIKLKYRSISPKPGIESQLKQNLTNLMQQGSKP